jgi:hypothetical protein
VKRKLQGERKDEKKDKEGKKAEKKISTITFGFEVLTVGHMKLY